MELSPLKLFSDVPLSLMAEEKFNRSFIILSLDASSL